MNPSRSAIWTLSDLSMALMLCFVLVIDEEQRGHPKRLRAHGDTVHVELTQAPPGVELDGQIEILLSDGAGDVVAASAGCSLQSGGLAVSAPNPWSEDGRRMWRAS